MGGLDETTKGECLSSVVVSQPIFLKDNFGTNYHWAGGRKEWTQKIEVCELKIQKAEGKGG